MYTQLCTCSEAQVAAVCTNTTFTLESSLESGPTLIPTFGIRREGGPGCSFLWLSSSSSLLKCGSPHPSTESHSSCSPVSEPFYLQARCPLPRQPNNLSRRDTCSLHAHPTQPSFSSTQLSLKIYHTASLKGFVV